MDVFSDKQFKKIYKCTNNNMCLLKCKQDANLDYLNKKSLILIFVFVITVHENCSCCYCDYSTAEVLPLMSPNLASG